MFYLWPVFLPTSRSKTHLHKTHNIQYRIQNTEYRQQKLMYIKLPIYPFSIKALGLNDFYAGKSIIRAIGPWNVFVPASNHYIPRHINNKTTKCLLKSVTSFNKNDLVKLKTLNCTIIRKYIWIFSLSPVYPPLLTVRKRLRYQLKYFDKNRKYPWTIVFLFNSCSCSDIV